MTRLVATAWIVASIGLYSAGEAQAQGFFRRGVARQGMPGTMTVAPAPTLPAVSYSYYVRPSRPVRTYVGYGDNDFPFYGAPYGHPYDPWTWETMSGSYQGQLSRYYAPPLK